MSMNSKEILFECNLDEVDILEIGKEVLKQKNNERISLRHRLRKEPTLSDNDPGEPTGSPDEEEPLVKDDKEEEQW